LVASFQNPKKKKNETNSSADINIGPTPFDANLSVGAVGSPLNIDITPLVGAVSGPTPVVMVLKVIHLDASSEGRLSSPTPLVTQLLVAVSAKASSSSYASWSSGPRLKLDHLSVTIPGL